MTRKANGVVGTGHNFVRNVLDLGLHFREAAADESLGGGDGVFGIEHSLALC